MSKKLPVLKGKLASLGLSARRWAASFVAPAQQISQADTFLYGAGSTTVASLLTSGKRQARNRQTIYDKWAEMEGDPLVSTAVSLLLTAALGGHKTSGQLVFVEKAPKIAGNKQREALVEEISDAVAPLLNRIARGSAYTGAIFGDAYGRVYTDARGVVDVYTDEMVRPPLVQPFERGSHTVGYAVYIGERNFERLDVSQMARLKMSRQQWVPQYGVVEKALRLALTEDDLADLPILPSMVGGSFLYNVEPAYDDFIASLLGLVGQRWLDSIDEQMVTVNLESMTIEQQEKFLESITTLLKSSKSRAEEAVKNGRPILEKIRHIIPVFNDKQVTNLAAPNGGQPGRAGSISIEDVLFHAKRLSGGLGVDLTMLGFADQLAGGLGEGGFFRTSAQAAERARVIRGALADYFNQILDIHTYRRYGVVFPVSERPWDINFYGSISALQAEKEKTRVEAMNGGLLLTQAIQGMKDLGADKKMMETFLSRTLRLDEDEAAVYAKIVDRPPPEGGDEGGGEPSPGKGGPFGGGR